MTDTNLIRFHATVPTPRASRNMVRLFKHFAHKVEVTYDTQSAHGDFPFGRCDMQASDDALRIDCCVPGEQALARMRYVIDDHLFRFSGEEALEVSWQEGPHPAMDAQGADRP